MTTQSLCPALGMLIVYVSYMGPKFSTHTDKLAFALKQLSVGNMEEDVGKENSQVQKKYQEQQGPGNLCWESPFPNCLSDGSKWSPKNSHLGPSDQKSNSPSSNTNQL